MEIKNTLCFYSRRSWWFYRFLRTLYAVGFTQYALSNKLGVIECLGFESLASTLNHQLSTINSQLKSLILVLGSFLFPLSSRSKNHPEPSSPTKAHPSGGGEYPVVLRRSGNDTSYFLFSSEINCAFKILHLVSWISYLFSFLFPLSSFYSPRDHLKSKI